MFTLILAALGIAVYGMLIALFWEDAHLAIACMALQYHVSPETLDWLQPESRRSVLSDTSCSDATTESDRDESGSSVTIDATSPLVEIDDA
jgi:hypothetical protein